MSKEFLIFLPKLFMSRMVSIFLVYALRSGYYNLDADNCYPLGGTKMVASYAP
jgi:hypothetical protein